MKQESEGERRGTDCSGRMADGEGGEDGDEKKRKTKERKQREKNKKAKARMLRRENNSGRIEERYFTRENYNALQEEGYV